MSTPVPAEVQMVGMQAVLEHLDAFELSSDALFLGAANPYLGPMETFYARQVARSLIRGIKEAIQEQFESVRDGTDPGFTYPGKPT
jgi:hypothetical protein